MLGNRTGPVFFSVSVKRKQPDYFPLFTIGRQYLLQALKYPPTDKQIERI